MKFHKKTLIINTVVFAALILFAAFSGMAGVGIAAFLLGLADFFIGLVLVFTSQRNAGLTLLIYSGILLLVGFSICSSVPFNMQ